MQTTLRAYDRAGHRLGVLPWTTLSRTIVQNAPGALTTACPKSLLTDALLGEEVYLRVVEDGVESPDWYLLDDDGDNDADAGGAARPVTIGGTGVATCLEWALVYPMAHTPGAPLLGMKATYEFGNATPGKIMLDLLARAHARGAIPHITTSFTADVDSAGRPWPATYSRVYDLGTTLGKVLSTMVEDSWVDYNFYGFTLELFVPDTFLAEDFPDTVLRLGDGVTQAPRKRTRKTSRSTVLANGAEGATVELSDPDATARLGRRESYEGRGGITDVGTLTAATTVSLSRQTRASESVTLAIEPSLAPIIPRPGAFIRYDQRRLNANQLEPMRVRSIAWSYGSDPTISVELADMWTDRDVRLERRIDAILNGSSANERVPVPPAGNDHVAPGPVSGLAVVSTAYLDPTTGQLQAQVTASWLEVLADADGSPIDDLLGYDIEWKQTAAQPGTHSLRTRVVTVQTWSPVLANVAIDVRIRAVDRYENGGAWSNWVTIITGKDITPPPAPSDPLVDNYLGLLRAEWRGTFAGGAARPPDLARVEVHVSTVQNFTIDVRTLTNGGTLAGSMTTKGPVFVDVSYAVPYYVKLVAVDTSDNRSAASAEVSGSAAQIVSDDLFTDAVDSRVLKDLAVQTAHIQELDLNNARVSTINVGKLTAGIITAQVTVSGRIATALSGKRAEMNSVGFQAWSSNGTTDTLTVSLDGVNNLLTGTFRTAPTGRRVELASAGLLSQIDFWSPYGGQQRSYVRSFTESTGIEAMQLGVGDPTISGLDNRINMNYDPTKTPNTSYMGARFTNVQMTVSSYFSIFSSARSYSESFLSMDGVSKNVWWYVGAVTTTGTGANVAEADSFRWRVYPASGVAVDWKMNDDGTVELNLGSAYYGGYIKLDKSTQAFVTSPRLQFITSQGYGGYMRFNGNGAVQEMEFKYFDDSFYINARANLFINNSDATSKQDIGDADLDYLATIAGTRVRRYKRTKIDKAQNVLTGDYEVGLIAQEAPAQIVNKSGSDGSLGIDLYQMSSLLWGASQQLKGEVEWLKAELTMIKEMQTT
jgi:hypothetical protein